MDWSLKEVRWAYRIQMALVAALSVYAFGWTFSAGGAFFVVMMPFAATTIIHDLRSDQETSE